MPLKMHINSSTVCVSVHVYSIITVYCRLRISSMQLLRVFGPIKSHDQFALVCTVQHVGKWTLSNSQHIQYWTKLTNLSGDYDGE